VTELGRQTLNLLVVSLPVYRQPGAKDIVAGLPQQGSDRTIPLAPDVDVQIFVERPLPEQEGQDGSLARDLRESQEVGRVARLVVLVEVVVVLQVRPVD
jgi:hypothetical protein